MNKNEKINYIWLKLVFVLFIIITTWWLYLTIKNPSSDDPRLLWAASYGVVALIGGIYGLFTAKYWGFLKSSLGRTILFLSLALLFAEFGQLVFSYYNVFKKVDIPYPSIADIGFFGNMLFYIFAGISLMQVLSVKLLISRKKIKLFIGILLPIILLVTSYLLFLKGYSTQDVSNLQIFLDFGYPLGDAVYVSLALVTLLSAATYMGGKLKKPLILILIALLVQYSADFNFLYQNSHSTWVNGHYGDYLYFFAYTVMFVSLILLSITFKKISSRSMIEEQT